MKKILLILLIILPVYIGFRIYFLDKKNFLCPIAYRRDMIIRCDSGGDGFFAADRSGNRLHQGVDLLADLGEPVLAARSGLVTAAQSSKGMGNFIIIRHSAQIATIYGHLSRIDVRKGDFVHQGQIIGAVGKTGNASSRTIEAHLHFEVRKGGAPQDPLEYLE
ncbi:MAG: M23 family metallopeptidase [Candidatus Omnitrophota bacterium]